MAIDFDSYSFFDGTDQTAVTQRTWADYWKGVIPDGVVAGIGDEMVPTGYSGGMVVKVASGACFTDNHRGVINSEKVLTIPDADATKPRIDLIVARVVYDNSDSRIELDVVEGTAATTPEAPALTQNSTVYEIKLAEVYVDAAAITIAAEKVTDFRNVFECGEQAFAFRNADSVALEKGMVVTLSNTVEGGVRKCHAAELPVGVVRSTYITPGATGQIDTKPGTISEIKCDSNAVKIGDALVVGGTDGEAQPGGGLAAGLALQAKASGIIGNVKSLLTIFSRIPIQNAWYIVDGIVEDQVLAAYQFVNRKSATEALLNVNQGEELPLVLQSTAVTWSETTGYTFLGRTSSTDPRLDNEILSSDLSTGLASRIMAAAFGYKLEDNSSSTNQVYCGGICISWQRSLLLRGFYWSSGSRQALNAPAISKGVQHIHKTNTSTNRAGVIGGNWKNTTPSIFVDGADLTDSTAYLYNNADGYNFPGGIGNPVLNTLPFSMNAVVFYSTDLTADQHLQLSNNIAALGGLS